MSYYEEQLKSAEERAWKERIKRVNNRLKSCLCCGGKAEVKERSRPDGYCSYNVVYIECSRCRLRTKELITNGYYGEKHGPEEAADLWNRRYSGIDDKNGMPICEGDHIRIVGKNWADSIRGVYEVCYSDVSFTWWLKRVIDDADYICSRALSFSELKLSHFTDGIELVRKED